ncbi:DinB family protein [Pedobacter sp. SYP-B3415]|uniref:DinB family protein n=1 Tax=Pedobacter sp. SYP-B3415 TaxID=2496641 RepID=UPI00101DA58F|nr:DinB family protein [Pedobacter sp. SYP-B3415]
MNRPQPEEYASWGAVYIDQITGDVFEDLENQVLHFTDTILAHRQLESYAYAPGKWTMKELLGHMVDTERILVFRLTAFARNDKTALPGFEEDDYVRYADFAGRQLDDLVQEFVLLRKSNLFLFRGLTEAQLDRRGTMTDGRIISVRALLYVIAGHVNHHQRVLETKYLKQTGK